MTTRNLGPMPRETKIALLLLLVALISGFALALVPIAQNWSAVVVQPASWWLKAFGAYPISAALIFALGRGYGWPRWLFLIGALFIAVMFFVNLELWARIIHTFAVFAFFESLIMLLRVAALVLLFRPVSNAWYAGRNATPKEA